MPAYLNVDPPPVSGIHTWVIETAWKCRKAGLRPEQTLATIESFQGSMRRPLGRWEASQAIGKVWAARAPARPPAEARKLAWDAAETARLCARYGVTRACLWHDSPVIPDDGLTPAQVISALFPDPMALLCTGRTISHFHTGPRAEHGDFSTLQFIVPAPMTSREGVTQGGRTSMHCKANTGPRRFIVFDFDEPPPEEQPGIIRHLATFRPLALVVHSGGKSLHAWFPVSARSADDEIFWRIGITLGADAALWRNASSFVRLPLGLRTNGRRQEVLYFNPAAIPTHP